MNDMTRKPSGIPLQVPYHCQVCAIDMAFASASSHLAGKKHRNQCAVLSAVGDRPSTPGTGGSISTTAAGTGYSGICDAGMPEGVGGHMATAPHRNSAKHNERRAAARTKHRGFCGEEIPGVVNKHMAGMPHRDTAKRANQPAPPADGHNQPANLDPTLITFTPPLGSTEPVSTDSTATYHCDICSRNLFTALRQQHLKGLIHAEAMAMLTAKKSWTEPGEESIRKQLGSKPTPVASGTEAGPAGYETHEREEGGGKAVIGDDQMKGTIAAGGTADKKRKAVEVGDGSIAASEEEHATDTDFTTTSERQHIPQPDDSAPRSPSTPQSQYSTAHVDPDSGVRQLNTPTGFVAHMAGKTRQCIMEVKIADQEEINIREENIAREAVILSVSSESVGRKEPVLRTRPLSATQPKFPIGGSLERYLARPSMQMHVYPHLVHGESKASPDLKQLPDKIPAEWYCSSCAEYVNVDTRDEHLGSLLHLLGRGKNPASDAGPGVVGTHPVAYKVTLFGDTHNAKNRVLCKKKFGNISMHLLPRAYLRTLPNYQPPPGKLYCRICSQEYPELMHEMHRTPSWDCELCGTRTHTRFRKRHLEGPAHAPRVAVELAAVAEDHVLDAPAEETEFDNLDFSTFWDKTPKDMSTDLLTKAHLAMRCSIIDESGDDEGRTDIEGAGAEEDSRDCGVFDILNELVGSRPLEKNPELHITREAEPEIWNCSLCEKDMPPAVRKAHETDPSHIDRLEQKKHEVASRTEQQTPVIPPEPAKPRVALFRCLVCLTTYGPSGRHLHSTPPWHCDSCDITLHTSAKQDHLSTVSHRLKESTPEKKHTEPTFTPVSKNTFFCLPCHRNLPTSERKFHISPPYYCTLCGLVMHTDTRDIHEWSLPHSRSVAAATAIPEEKSKMFNCQTCNNNFPVAVQPFHRSRSWTCELCKVTVHMDWIGAHLASVEHVTSENDQELQEDVEEGGVSIS